jgi:very-short-patch-repair endonuclease
MCSSWWKHCGRDDCHYCYTRSFSSYDGMTLNGKRKVDCLVEPMDARLPISSAKKVQFNCDVCKHSYSSSLRNITKGSWCGMCSISRWKHCGKTDCTFCYERSFASYEGVTPNGKRKVDCLVEPMDARLTISSNKKVQFNCDVCKHSFSARLNKIKRGSWCGMCSSKWKHCGKADCTFCYERSFASYEGVTPNGKRKVDCLCLVNANDARYGLGSKKKLEFNCDVCDNTFSTRLNCISSGHWCPHCKNKTEAKVLRFLRNELKLKVMTQYTIRHEVRTYKKRFRFDFYLPAHGIILEVDGLQHTQEVSIKWMRSSLLHRQIIDAWKERLARRNDIRVVRLDQPSIWADSYDWKSEIKDILHI